MTNKYDVFFPCKCNNVQVYETDAYASNRFKKNETKPHGEEKFTACFPVVTA